MGSKVGGNIINSIARADLDSVYNIPNPFE